MDERCDDFINPLHDHDERSFDDEDGFTEILLTKPVVDPSWRDSIRFTLKAARWRSVAAFLVFIVLSVMFALVGTQTFWKETLTWQGWFTLYTVIVMISCLVLELWDVSLSFFGANLILLLVKIISVQEALAGFASESIISILTMYIIAAGIEKTKLLDWLVKHVLRRPSSLRSALFRVLPPIGFLSAWVNNTPIVAVMIPVLGAWSIRAEMAISQLLMPMSFSVTLGGLLTIIGTSTNLVVQGLAGPTVPLGFFQIGALGAPFALVGLVYIILFAQYLLPPVTTDRIYISRVFAWHFVGAASPHIGQSLPQTNLVHLSGADLVWIKPEEENRARAVPDLKVPVEDPQDAHLTVVTRR